MLGRRSIRIKTMQSIFSLHTNPYLSAGDAEKNIHQSIENFHHLYHYILYTLVQVANYVTTDAELKASKHLVEEEDKRVSMKLLDNEVIQHLENHDEFQKIAKKQRFNEFKEQHVIRSLYKKVNAHEAYQEYTNNVLSGKEEDYEIAALIMTKVMLKNEVFQKNIEDHFTNFLDDFDFIYKITSKTFKKAAKKQSVADFVFQKNDFYNELISFSSELFYKTIENEELLTDEINDYLKNWDANRLALTDIILLQMALCEMLYFEQIPVKVTMNEYIDISKEYSTPKSKEFINGVLDNMMKTLKKEGKIVKKGRGLN